MNYKIEGEPMPVVLVDLEAGEAINCQKGAMSWMSANMQMDTNTGGGIGKAFSRMVSGEKLFQNTYIAQGGNGHIAFASAFTGSIRAFEIAPGKSIIAQKSAYLAATTGVEFSIAIQKKIGGGFFGGEGFIMQKFAGQGIAFLEFDGYVKEYELAAGQKIIIDTGYLAAMDETVTMDVETVGGKGLGMIKNAALGGEGLFNTTVVGPGKIWIQSMPVAKMAETLRPFFTTSSN